MMNKDESLLNKLFETKYIVIFLVVITFAYYGQCLFFDFLTFDDDKFITQNELINNPSTTIIDCFKYKLMEHDYFPFTFFAFWVLKSFFGLNPVFFHALNLLLHILNVVLVFLLVRKLLEKLIPKLTHNQIWAGFIALLFSIIPLHVESVAWATDLKDLLYSSFYLAGILTYWKWHERGNIKFYLLSFLFALLALLSKSTAITFIAILIWIDWLNNEKWGRKMVVSKIPFLFLTILGFFIVGIVSNPLATLGGITGETDLNFVPDLPSSIAGFPVIFQRMIIASFRLLFWLFHSLFPFKISLFYTSAHLLGQFSFILPVLPFLLIALVLMAWNFRKKLPTVFPGLLFFLITISPALAKTDTGVSVFVPDRYMYLPIIGLLILFSSIVQYFNRKVIYLICFSIFIFWSFMTLSYLPVWKNSIALYNYSLKLDPDNMVARMNRSMYYLTHNEEDKAFNDLDIYLKKFPNTTNELAYLNHGILLRKKGELDKALINFNYSLKLKPNNFQALVNRGSVFLLKNDFEKARTDFSTAYDIDSTNFALNKNISSLYNKTQNHTVALFFAEKCLAGNKTDVDLLRIKGVSLFYCGRNKEAIEVISGVLEDHKEKGEMWYFRAMAQYNEGNIEDAYADYIQAKKLNVKIDNGFETKLNDSMKRNK